MGTRRLVLRQLALLTTAACVLPPIGASGPAAAQASFPTRPVRIVVGVPAGGVSDTLTRAVGQELGKKWGQAVVVENRPGASGVIAATSVSKSAPDGHTIFMTHNVQFVTTPLLLDRPPYEPIMEFAPVIGLVRVDDVLLASQRSSATSVEQLIALGRTQPGRLNYGSFGPGSATHLDAESFSAAAGIKATHIPYKGGPDVLKALVTGEIDFAFTGLTAALPLIKDGRVIAIAYSGRRRAAVLPEVPTLAERGLKVAAGGWFGWFVPAGTPNAVIERIAADAADVLAQPDFRARHVIGVGLEPLSLPPAELSALLKSDVATYVPLVKGLSRVTQ